MEIITRKYAKSVGLPKYFTGKNCIHGHLTYRYTQSGTCSACVSLANGGRPMGSEPKRDLRRGEPIDVDPAMAEQLADYDANTTTAKVVVHELDTTTMHDTARAMLQGRYPAIAPAVFRVPLKVVQRMDGVVVYSIRCHSSDSDVLIAIGRAMTQARNTANRVAERAYEMVLAQNLAAADAERPGPPALGPGVLT